jgi:hypothetical protein
MAVVGVAASPTCHFIRRSSCEHDLMCGEARPDHADGDGTALRRSQAASWSCSRLMPKPYPRSAFAPPAAVAAPSLGRIERVSRVRFGAARTRREALDYLASRYPLEASGVAR